MNLKIIFPVMLAAMLMFLSFPARAASPPWLAADPQAESLQTGMTAVLAPLYYSDHEKALEEADAFLASHPNHPLPLIVKARVLREGLLEQDLDTDPIKTESEPIHDLLDQAVALCDAAAEAGTDQPADIFYKGWALMFKSQLHAIATSNYAAGRTAANGYDELEKYLELEPYDPDARGFLGIYQFFADTLPGLAKFFSKLLAIPGGNESMGLANMRFACAKEGPLLTDHQVVRASTFVFFAGRLEDALKEYGEITQVHPAYVRLAEPLAVASLFYPTQLTALRNLQHDLTRHHVMRLEAGSDWKTLRRLSFYNSLAAQLYESPTAAVQRYEELIAKGPLRPDWMIPFARHNLACLLAGFGRHDEARAIFTELAEGEREERIRKAAAACLDDEGSWREVVYTIDMDFIAAIHDGRLQEARDGLDLYGLRVGQNLVYNFFSGELNLVAGNLDEAQKHFLKVLKMDAPLMFQIYRMFAAARLAEIHGTEGDFEAARSQLKSAVEMRFNEPILRLVLRGRERYYRNQDQDEIETDPALVMGTSGGARPVQSLPQAQAIPE